MHTEVEMSSSIKWWSDHLWWGIWDVKQVKGRKGPKKKEEDQTRHIVCSDSAGTFYIIESWIWCVSMSGQIKVKTKKIILNVFFVVWMRNETLFCVTTDPIFIANLEFSREGFNWQQLTDNNAIQGLELEHQPTIVILNLNTDLKCLEEDWWHLMQQRFGFPPEIRW